MTDSALFYRMEVRLGPLVAVGAYILCNHIAGLLAGYFPSRYLRATGCPLGIGFVAGHA